MNSAMTMKIGITGCLGRVGSLLVSELRSGAWDGLELAGGLEREIRAGAPPYVTDNAEDFFEKADLVIDFTVPAATKNFAALAAAHKTALVIGTTGLGPDEEAALGKAAETVPIVYAANMSVGVTMLLALVEQAAARLGPAWDIEIFEAHHKHKIDAPSGTALALGKAAKAGRGGAGDFVRERAGKRGQGDIGFSVARGGDVVGEHIVTFYGEGERLALSHVATNRALFARGALTAALWCGKQKPGLYSMRDVLGL